MPIDYGRFLRRRGWRSGLRIRAREAIAAVIGLTLGLTPVAVTLSTAPAGAAVFTVTKVTDTNDGVCDADCSLREAIDAADNAVTGADVITVDPALAGQTIVLGSGISFNNGTDPTTI